MIRRINQTGRARILREHVRISTSRHPERPSTFTVKLDLESYELPSHANVFLEAYRETSWMRFHVGTVGQLDLTEFTLSEFDGVDGVLFRVKVVSADAEAKILAEADAISGSSDLDGDAPHHSLLPVKGEDLGDLIWWLELDPPLLKVNSNVGDWKGAVRSAAFDALVLPIVFRDILRAAAAQDGADSGDLDSWWGRWLRFAESLEGVTAFDPGAGEEEREDWIEQAVRSFSRRRKSFIRYKDIVERDGE